MTHFVVIQTRITQKGGQKLKSYSEHVRVDVPPRLSCRATTGYWLTLCGERGVMLNNLLQQLGEVVGIGGTIGQMLGNARPPLAALLSQ